MSLPAMASILPSSGPSSSSLATQRNLAQRSLVPSSSSIKPALGSSKSQSARLAPASSSSTIASAPPSPTKLKSAPLAPVLPASPAPSSSSSNTTTSLAKKDSTGPLVQPSKEWVLPARAKPGRKPSETEPLTKRKAQNRASQRAFRERKQSYLAELEAKVAAYEAAEIDRSVEIQKVAQKLRAENEALRKEVGNWKEKFMQLERFLLQAKANGGKLPGTVVTPSVKSGPGCKAPAHERAAPKRSVLVAPGGKDGKARERCNGGVRFADAVQGAKNEETEIASEPAAAASVPLRRRPSSSFTPTTPVEVTSSVETVAIAAVSTEDQPLPARKGPKPPLWSFETPKTPSPPAASTVATSSMASIADKTPSLLSPSLLPDGGHLSIGGGCGFCTEASPCVCADDFLDLSSAASSSQLSHIAVPNDVPSALPLPKRNPAATASSALETSRRMSIGSLTHANDVAHSQRKRSTKLWYTVTQPSPPSPPRSVPLSIKSRGSSGKKLWSLTEAPPAPAEPVCTGDPSTCGACSTDPGLAAFCEAVTTATSTTPATSPTPPVMMRSGTLPVPSSSAYSSASLRGETIPSAWRQIRSHPRFSQWQGGLDLLAEVVSKRSGNVKSPMLPHATVGEKRGREASVEIEPSRTMAAGLATSNDRATSKPVLLHTASEGSVHSLPRAKVEEGEEDEREGKRRRIVIDREAVQEALALLDAGTAAQPRSSSAKEEQPCPCPWRPGDKRSSPP